MLFSTILFFVFTYQNDVKGVQAIEVVYLATFIDALEKIRLNPEDHSEYVWLAESELDQAVDDGVKGKNDPEIKAIIKGFSLLE